MIPDLQPSRALEYLTFGRKPWLLLRVWILQILIIFSDVRVFRIIHPGLADLLPADHVFWIYTVETLVAVVVLVATVARMGKLTFSARLREPRSIALSTLGFLLLTTPVIAIVYPAPNLPPRPAGGISAVELALSLLVTVNLSALLALGLYIQFDYPDFPSRERMGDRVAAWRDAFDWIEEDDASLEKQERYSEFQERTDAVEAMLENAMTEEGVQLRDEFTAWREEFERHSLVSQEAIVAGDVRNPRLERQHQQLHDIADRLEYLAL